MAGRNALPRITAYTDGGCRPNPGPGGWGVVLLETGETPRELSGGAESTTNNRMEMQAAIEALEGLAEPHRVTLITDSLYLKRGVTEWLPRWQKSGWRTSTAGDVKNRDLWERLARQLERHDVGWKWTKGHAGDRWNERADRLAAKAIPRPELPVVDPSAVHLALGVVFSGSTGRGGWAAVLRYGEETQELSGAVDGTSSNRMHLFAAVEGLRRLRRTVRVHVYTVSDYLKDGATSWLAGWKRRGWRRRDGEPVSHRELWSELDGLMHRHEIQWHVATADQIEELEQAKQLARTAVGPT